MVVLCVSLGYGDKLAIPIPEMMNTRTK